jgi:hypothetical protein
MDKVNDGRLKRMKNTSFPLVTTNNGAVVPPPFTGFVNANTLATYLKNGVYSATDLSIQYFINASIPVHIIHDFFSKLPPIRGPNIKLYLYLNTNTTYTFTADANGVFTDAVPTSVPRNTCPFMISPLNIGGTSNPTGLQSKGALLRNFTVKLNINNSTTNGGAQVPNSALTQCRFFACQFKLNPEYETAIVSSPNRRVLYNDFFHYSITNVADGQAVTQLLTNGYSRLRGFLMFPVVNSASNGGFDSMQSPFTSCPGTVAPYTKVSNFQINIAGSPIFQTNQLQFSYEHYLQEVQSALSINGASLRSIGLSSGLISKTDFENGYGFYFVNLDKNKTSEADDNVSKSVTVLFKSNSLAGLNLDYHILLFYEKEININVSTGDVVSL